MTTRAAALAVMAMWVCACRHGGTLDDDVGDAGDSSASGGDSSGGDASVESAGHDASDTRTSSSSAASESGGSDTATTSEASEGSEDAESSGGGLELVTLTLAYGPDPAQTLDLVLPEPPEPSLPSLPLVVLAHGGLWQGGSKAALTQTCANLVLGSQGTLACATIDYRLSDALGGSCMGGPATYEDQLRDFAAAVVLLQQDADVHGLAREAVHVGGHSAGGHLALSLALRWPTFTATCDPLTCPAPRGAIGIEGIYDIAAWDAYDQSFWNGTFACATRKAFGDPPGSPSACIDADTQLPCWSIGSPTYLAGQADTLGLTSTTASLLIHSPDDDWVDFAEATALGDALALAFPRNPRFVAVDGSCGVGSHDAVLVDPALTSCVLAFVASGGTSLAP